MSSVSVMEEEKGEEDDYDHDHETSSSDYVEGDNDADHKDGKEADSPDKADPSGGEDTEDDCDSDDDDSGMDWSSLAGGDFLVEECGRILVQGTTIAVTVLDGGYFYYNPIYQRHLFPVYVLQCALYQVVKNVSLASTSAKVTASISQEIASNSGLMQLLKAKQEAAATYIAATTTLRWRGY
jgi:hypothetical protein